MPFSVFAEESPEKAGKRIEENIDYANEYIATKWDQLNRNIDFFFTNSPTPRGENKSSVAAYTSFYKKEGEKLEPVYDFQLKIDLPNITKKLKIVIEKQQDEITNALSDSSVSNDRTRASDKKEARYTAGANYLLSKSKDFSSYVNFGIRLDMPINPFAKVDLIKNIKFDSFWLELSQKFIYYRQEGFQEISQVIVSKKWGRKLQTDLINSLVWTDEDDDLILRNGILLTYLLGREKTLTYSAGANARFSPMYHYDSYDTSLSYRQLIYKDWLYAAWTIGADFPKEHGFKDEKFIQFRLDIFFKEK